MRVSAVIPAFNNERSIQHAIRALLLDERVAEVIVIDDASSDSTATVAEAAGATVVRLETNVGKGPALERGFGLASEDVFLMVDGDTGETAASTLDLIDLIEQGADMAVGILPSAGKQGGFGLVRNTAAWFIRITSGFTTSAPMSGQRVLRRVVFERCRPFAHGFAVDAAMTADAVRHGLRVVEAPVEMTHDHRGRSLRGFTHRAGQGLDLLRAFLPRMIRRPAGRRPR